MPVENTYHGSALIYRLLSGYPAERLVILESNLHPSQPERRVPNVPYHDVRMGSGRLQHTRLHRYHNAALFLWAAFGSMAAVNAQLNAFRPQAILTVTHGQLWLQAARYARRHQLPLHLIHHDDWPSVAGLPAVFAGLLNRRFGEVYRQAVSRACVSPHMEQEYRRRYHAAGMVSYPSRAAHQEPASQITVRDSQQMTVAFAGTINTQGYVQLLRELAVQLQAVGGSLLIYGPENPAAAAASGLDLDNISLKGFVPSQELPARLRAEADVLFVPMSFAEADRPNMQMGFPSKLADYTAVGLPLLICGPEYCSASVWARENPGVAELATSSDHLHVAVHRLTAAEHRQHLARQALLVGARYFGAAAAKSVFIGALTNTK